MRQMMKVHDADASIRPLLEGSIVEMVEGLRRSGMLCGGEAQGPDGGSASPIPAPLVTHEIRDGEARLLRSKVGAKWQSFVHGDRSPEYAMQEGGFRIDALLGDGGPHGGYRPLGQASRFPGVSP